MPATLSTANPIEVVLAVFNRLYPDVDVKIRLKIPEVMPKPDASDLDPADYGLGEIGPGDTVGVAGVAIFDPTGAKPPEIWINLDTPLMEVPNTLIEELAHVVCGHEEGHGPRFVEVYEHLAVEVQALLFTPMPNNTAIAELARTYVNRREAGVLPLVGDYEALRRAVQAEHQGAAHDA